MTALGYLFLTKWKNRIKAFIKKPLNWVVALLFIGLMGVTIWSGSEAEASAFRPMGEVFAMVSALYIILFLMTTYQGLNRGTTLFSMSDVEHLFVAPIKPAHVLYYGLVQQMGTSVMIGCFLLFQYGWMHQTYGVSMGAIAIVLLGYAVAIFMGQFLAMVLYPWVAGRPARRNGAKAVLFGLVALLAAWVVIPAALNPGANWLETLAARADTWAVYAFPIAGWMSGAVKLVLAGHALTALLPLALCVLCFVALTECARRGGSDFYEDVLAATQRSHQAITAQKEGQVQEVIPENVKVGHTGLGRGWGASAFYYKHRLESRRSRRFVFDTITLVMMVVVWVFGYFVRDTSPYFILGFGAYMQLFVVGMGRWAREFTKPTAYLMPEKPFRKLLWLMMESIQQYALEAVVFTLPIAWFMHLSVPAALCFMLGRMSFSLLYMVGSMVQERLFAGIRAKMLVLMIYIIIMLLMMAPGVVLTVLWGTSLAMGLLILAATNVCVAVLALFLCRNVMNYAEMQ